MALDPFRPRMGLAQCSNGKTLIVLFQRGGCDGLNTVVPYGDPHYAAVRPDIAIAPPSGASTHRGAQMWPGPAVARQHREGPCQAWVCGVCG